MRKNFIFIILFLLLVIHTNGQSISKPWFSGKNVICFTLDSVSHSCKIDFYNRMKYKRKGNKLKITWSVNQTIFGWQKEHYWFEINKLTNDSLKITLLNNFDKELFELLGGDSVLTFVAMPEGCDSLPIKEFIKSGKIKALNKTGSN